MPRVKDPGYGPCAGFLQGRHASQPWKYPMVSVGLKEFSIPPQGLHSMRVPASGKDRRGDGGYGERQRLDQGTLLEAAFASFPLPS